MRVTVNEHFEPLTRLTTPGYFEAVRAARGQLSGVSVFHRKTIFVWGFSMGAQTLNGPKRRFPARADAAGPKLVRGDPRGAEIAHDL